MQKFAKGISTPWSGPWILHDITHNCGLIQNLGSHKTKFVSLQRLRLCTTPVAQWQKQLTKLRAENSVDENPVGEKTSVPGSEERQGMIFDLENDVVILNPEAVATHQPRVIKQEASPGPTQSSLGTLDTHRGSHDALASTSSSDTTGILDTLGTSSPSSLQTDPGILPDFLQVTPSPTKIPKPLTTGKGKELRVARLPTETSGRLTRQTATSAGYDPPNVFGDAFWSKNKGQPGKGGKSSEK